MKKKTIWMINQYASTPQTAIGGRHFYLAEELVKQGHIVYLIAASFTHILRTPPVLTKVVEMEMINGVHFVWIKMPSYDHAHSKKRILNWFLFAYKLLKIPEYITYKPDAIFYSSPSLIPFLTAKFLAKKFKCRLVFEVRDIWPLTLTSLGGYSERHPFIRFLQWIEDKAYLSSDRVVSNLPNSIEHMVNRRMPKDKFAWIPNGYSRTELQKQEPLTEQIIAKLPKDKFLVGYTGTMGTANALDSFILSATYLKDDADVCLILVGQGKDKIYLQDLVVKKNLNNVIFIDPIPKVMVQSMLRCFDICFIGWKNNPLYKFGIAANKLNDYFCASRPVVHAFSGNEDLVNRYNAGITVPAEDSKAIAEAILLLKSMSKEQRDQLGANGKRNAEKYHDYANLAQKLAKVVSDNE